jgi:hypothetical protein
MKMEEHIEWILMVNEATRKLGLMMRPRCPECDCVLTREGDWDDTPTGFCSYCGWPNRYDEEEE